MKKSKIVACLLAPSLCVVILCGYFVFVVFVQEGTESKGKIIIDAYMQSKGLHYQLGTKEYSLFMRGILEGNYQELTRIGAGFVENEEELSEVLAYADQNYYWGKEKYIRKFFRLLYKETQTPDLDLDQP